MLNNFILTTFLVISYYAVAITGLLLRIVHGLSSSTSSESSSAPSASPQQPHLLISCGGILLVWFMLSLINTRFVGFYSLQIFYALIVLRGSLYLINKPWKSIYQTNNYPFLFFLFSPILLAYAEALIYARPELSENILAAFGLWFLAYILSLFVAIFFTIFWFVLGSLGISGVISNFVNRQSSSQTFDFGLIIQAFFEGFILLCVMIFAIIPILVTAIQSRILLIDFNLILWLNININLEIILLFATKKATEDLGKKTQKYLASSMVIGLAWLGLLLGYILPSNKQYTYNKHLLTWLIIIVGIALVLRLIGNLFTHLSQKAKIKQDDQKITTSSSSDIYTFNYILVESENCAKTMKISPGGNLLANRSNDYKSGKIKL